jgi:hypothetical protein
MNAASATVKLEQLVRGHVMDVQRRVRASLGAGLRKRYDSSDFRQSVCVAILKAFRNAVFKGWDSKRVGAYVNVVASNKLDGLYRKWYRERGDVSINSASSFDVVDKKAVDPARAAEVRDLHGTLWARMSDEVRTLHDMRCQGLTWPQIAERVGGAPDSIRMKYVRALADLRPES